MAPRRIKTAILPLSRSFLDYNRISLSHPLVRLIREVTEVRSGSEKQFSCRAMSHFNWHNARSIEISIQVFFALKAETHRWDIPSYVFFFFSEIKVHDPSQLYTHALHVPLKMDPTWAQTLSSISPAFHRTTSSPPPFIWPTMNVSLFFRPPSPSFLLLFPHSSSLSRRERKCAYECVNPRCPSRLFVFHLLLVCGESKRWAGAP